MPKYKIVMYGEIEAGSDKEAMEKFLRASLPTRMMLIDRVTLKHSNVSLITWHRTNGVSLAIGAKAKTIRARLMERHAA